MSKQRVLRACAILPGLLGLAACGGPVNNAPLLVNGWAVYQNASNIVCAGAPVLIEGSRQDLEIRGACRIVQITGSHNDISVTLAGGGEIEILGSHNDVSWQLAPGSAYRPILKDQGFSNSFHRIVAEGAR